MASHVADRLRRRLEHDADRIGYESRRRILPERVVRLRAQLWNVRNGKRQEADVITAHGSEHQISKLAPIDTA